MYYINKTYTTELNAVDGKTASLIADEDTFTKSEYSLTPGTVYTQGLDGNFWNVSMENQVVDFIKHKMRRKMILGTNWVPDPITTTRGGREIMTSSLSSLVSSSSSSDPSNVKTDPFDS